MKKNKTILYIALIVILVVVIGVIFSYFYFGKKDSSKEGLLEISFNGFKINDTFKRDSKYLLMDHDIFSYYYNDVYMNINNDDKIDALGFYESSDSEGNTFDINDISIKYQSKELKTVEDFKKAFDSGKESEKVDGAFSITFKDDKGELTLYIHNDKITSIILKKSVE